MAGALRVWPSRLTRHVLRDWKYLLNAHSITTSSSSVASSCFRLEPVEARWRSTGLVSGPSDGIGGGSIDMAVSNTDGKPSAVNGLVAVECDDVDPEADFVLSVGDRGAEPGRELFAEFLGFGSGGGGMPSRDGGSGTSSGNGFLPHTTYSFMYAWTFGGFSTSACRMLTRYT